MYSEIGQKSTQEPSGYSKRPLVTQLVATHKQDLTEGTNIPIFNVQMCSKVKFTLATNQFLISTHCHIVHVKFKPNGSEREAHVSNLQTVQANCRQRCRQFYQQVCTFENRYTHCERRKTFFNSDLVPLYCDPQPLRVLLG